MKSTGIVRKVDELGRIVIPIELRRHLGIHEHDALEIFTDKDSIVLRRYEPNDACVFCSESEDTTEFGGRHICHDCLEELRKERLA